MAVKNAGKAGKVAVFGTDTSEQLANFLLDDSNILHAVTGQRPFEIGSMAVEAAVKILKGEKVEKKVSLPGFLLSREKPDEIQQFKERLKERGILQAYDSIVCLINAIEYPIAELTMYFTDPTYTSLNAKSAHIFVFFIDRHIEELKSMAKEIDEDYRKEP